jgi:hypothetical protein
LINKASEELSSTYNISVTNIQRDLHIRSQVSNHRKRSVDNAFMAKALERVRTEGETRELFLSKPALRSHCSCADTTLVVNPTFNPDLKDTDSHHLYTGPITLTSVNKQMRAFFEKELATVKAAHAAGTLTKENEIKYLGEDWDKPSTSLSLVDHHSAQNEDEDSQDEDTETPLKIIASQKRAGTAASKAFDLMKKEVRWLNTAH